MAKRRGLDINFLKEIVTKLANGEPLDAKYKDHQLSGNWIGHRECHFNRTGFWSIVMKMMYLYLHLHVLELIATCLIYKD